MAKRISQRAIGLLSLADKLKLLPAAAQPTKYDHEGKTRWNKPLFSRRRLADLKREALAAGHTWPLPEKEEKPPGQSYHETRIFFSKGHKAERDKPARDEQIRKNMADMPKKIEEWRQAKASKKSQQTELQWILTGKSTFANKGT